MREPAIAEEVKPVPGAEPDSAVRAGAQSADLVVRRREWGVCGAGLPGGEPLVLPGDQPAVLSAYPYRAVSAFGQCHTVVVGERARVCDGENMKVQAVEAGQTRPGANPQVTVVSLEQAADGVLRKSVFGSPASDSIVLPR